MLRSRLECHKLSDPDCSERQAACHQRCSGLRQSRSPGGTSRWRSARKSPSSMCRAILYGRLGGASDGLPRQSPVSWIAMQPPMAAGWHIARRPLSGMPIDRAAAPGRPSLRSTSPCALMWKTGLPVSSRRQMVLAFVVATFGGKTAGRARARIGDGPKPGAPSRLPDACRSTSRTTRRCASATKPSIKLSSFRGVERWAVS